MKAVTRIAVAAGAVVTRDVPPHSLAAGVPARVIRSWGPAESVIHLQRPDLMFI